MSDVKWTKEQQDAIYEKGTNILVAAAAGSGKTAVLVERIIEKILNDKIDIDKLLVVTFTNAAASEMRERILDAIYKKLEIEPENTHLLRQITLLNKASICTIDSFCLEIVRDYFYELENVSPNFRIADTTEIDLLKQETIEDLFEKLYEEENEDFIKLVTTYSEYRDDSSLKELVLKVFTYIQSNPFPSKWLHEKIEMFNLKDKLERDFFETPWGKELKIEVEEELIDDINILKGEINVLLKDEELHEFYLTIMDDIDMLEKLKNSLDNWDKAYFYYQELKFNTWPRKKVTSDIKDKVKETRDRVKKKLNLLLDKVFVSNSKQSNEDIYEMYGILTKLEKLINEYEHLFSKRKRDKNIVDFNDVEHFALEILLKEDENGNIIPTEVANKYREKFAEIAIDEYQDSNLVQEYILTSISTGNNLFMVGDVKQSIYKFRQARPDLFLNKYESYGTKGNLDEDQGLKIQLFKNFRSRENVLDFTNIIFQDIMSKNVGDIYYNETEYLNLGASFPEEKGNLNTEIDIISIKDSREEDLDLEADNTGIEEIENEEDVTTERIENIELEARFVANRIKDLIDNKYQVLDKKTRKYRNITYKDIVILLRATSTAAPVFEQELLNLEMPVFSDSSKEYLDSIEIQTIMCLLKIIDNPMQDIPLVTVMRSNIGKFTDNDLVKIRLSDSYDNFYTCIQKALIDTEGELKDKIVNFLDMLDRYRQEQEYLALDEFIWKIYTDTGFYNYVGLMSNGELRQANLKMLFQKARDYETSNFKGLYNFIQFIEKLSLSSGDLGSAKLIGENDDVIRIMSIHKSKGLEFPVVFLSNIGKQFNFMDLNENILLHQDLGLGVKYINYDKLIKYDTLTKIALRNKSLIETLSEEMRILYVALTRAKEKLIITGVCKDYEDEIDKIDKQMNNYPKEAGKIPYIILKKSKRYLDWILLVYQYEKDTIRNIDFNVYYKEGILKQCKSLDKERVDVIKVLDEYLENNKIPKERLDDIKDILEYKYPNEIATTIPTKTSVTALKSLNENDDKIIDENIEFNKPRFLEESKEEKITAAKKGTLVHMCLQRLNPKEDYDINKIKELINSFVIKDILSPQEADCINPNKILQFTKSNIWKEMKEAKEVYQEKPFYINIPAKLVYDVDDLEETILVQGVVDLYYITKDDRVVLVDYKTDYVGTDGEAELVNKYKNQLGLYEKALEAALRKKVDKKMIYSVYLNKEIDL